MEGADRPNLPGMVALISETSDANSAVQVVFCETLKGLVKRQVWVILTVINRVLTLTHLNAYLQFLCFIEVESLLVTSKDIITHIIVQKEFISFRTGRVHIFDILATNSYCPEGAGFWALIYHCSHCKYFY